MCEDFVPNFGDKELAVVSRQRTVSHYVFHQGFFFTKNNITVGPHPPLFSISLIEDKTERTPF
jgi:hypothetical protein